MGEQARRNFSTTIKHKRVAFIEVGNKNEGTNEKNDFESFTAQDNTGSQCSHMLSVFMTFTHSTKHLRIVREA